MLSKIAVGDDSGFASIAVGKIASVVASLTGIRVVDLTHLWAGPLCTRILVDLGAEVVKVEAAERPDGLRLVASDDCRIPSFDRLNWGKKLLAINLRYADARKVLADLIAASDVVVDNYAPRVVDNWGLGWEVVSKWSRPILWVAMPAYSSAGRYGAYSARGSGLEAISGMATSRYDSGRPHFYPFPVTDPLSGWHASLAVMAGLHEVAATGRSLRIEVAQSEVALQLVALSRIDEMTSLREAVSFPVLDDVSPPYRGSVRATGMDTAAILRSLGYKDSYIQCLIQSGAVHVAGDSDGS